MNPSNKYTAWQVIASMLTKYPGEWFKLERRYKTVASAVGQARKTLAENYDQATAERLEFAYAGAQDGPRTIYLRVAPGAKNHAAPEGYVDPDQPSIYDTIAAAEAAGDAERITAPAITEAP